jgi:hypothetical protein
MATNPLQLTAKKGWLIFAVCWVVSFLVIYGLRQVLIPKEELDCYARVIILQKAVNQWNQTHTDKPIIELIDENALVLAGYLQPLTYDHERHFYFVGQTAHGPKVKCNKDEDNPMILKLMGDTLIAVLFFLIYCSYRGFVLFGDEGESDQAK